MIKRLNNSGDTLVEVLFATVVLSIVLAGAYTLSNRATKLNQDSFERTRVSNLLQQRVELVRAARDSYSQSDPSSPDSLPWGEVVARAKATVSNVDSVCEDLSIIDTNLSGSNAFNLTVDVTSGNISGTTDGKTVFESIYNLWIEVVDGNDYYDIHAIACWEGLSSTTAQRTSIIVRLEDPV